MEFWDLDSWERSSGHFLRERATMCSLATRAARQKLKGLAKKAGGKARAGTPGEAVEASDVLLLAVNWSQMDDVLKQAGDLSGKTIVSCSLPLNASNSDFVIAHTSSGAETLAKRFPKTRFVLAFNTIPSEVLFDVFEQRSQANKPSMMYCGDDSKAKKIAAQLIRDIGFDPLDIGALKMARYCEPFSMIIAEIAYGGARGPRVAYRFEWMGE